MLSEEQKKEMSLEEQYKDLMDKLEMTQAIKHGGMHAATDLIVSFEQCCHVHQPYVVKLWQQGNTDYYLLLH